MLSVLVCDAREEFDGDALREVLGVLGESSAAFGVLLQKNTEGAVLASAGKFDVNDFEAVGGGDAVGGGTDCVELQGHDDSGG